MCPPPDSANGWPQSSEKSTTVVINGCPLGYYCIMRGRLTGAILKQNPNAVVKENMTWPLTFNVTKDGESRANGLTGLANLIKMLLCLTSVEKEAAKILEADKSPA
jgi:hypothetical protein